MLTIWKQPLLKKMKNFQFKWCLKFIFSLPCFNWEETKNIKWFKFLRQVVLKMLDAIDRDETLDWQFFIRY